MSALDRYRHFFSGTENLNFLSLGEGSTPLVPSTQIGPDLGLPHLFFKLESLNPTGSYKDRFAAFAISRLKHLGSNICLATSSGNTGAALAAYAAVARIPCHIMLIDGTPAGKLKQMAAYGARLWMLKDFGIDEHKTNEIFRHLHSLALQFDTEILISAYLNQPVAMQGVESIAYELCEAERLPDHVFVPAGGGGLTLAMLRGFQKWSDQHQVPRSMKVHCVQPAGNDTMAGAIRDNRSCASAVAASTTKISGLQVPSVLDGHDVVKACRQTGGKGFLINDDRAFYWQEQLATREGIYAETAGAVSLAGLEQALSEQQIEKDTMVVCLVTGHGFKNTNTAPPVVTLVEDFKELKNTLS